LREWSLSDRRDALLDMIGEASPVLRFSQAWEATGAELFAAADANGLEGIVSKRLDLPYRSGRTES
jgi:bifunctional non-homologous end joining protein LigD